MREWFSEHILVRREFDEVVGSWPFVIGKIKW